jgi:hypothetical protein
MIYTEFMTIKKIYMYVIYMYKKKYIYKGKKNAKKGTHSRLDFYFKSLRRPVLNLYIIFLSRYYKKIK